MSRLTKIMLGLMIANAVASALTLTGIVNVSDFPGFYVVFPLAAIFYGMFLICHILEKDVTEFDAEQRELDDHAASGNHSEPAETIHGQEHHAPLQA